MLTLIVTFFLVFYVMKSRSILRKDQCSVSLLDLLLFSVWAISSVSGVEGTLLSINANHQRYDAKMAAAKTLKEVITGPLKEYRVTLMTSSDGKEEADIADEVTSAIHIPINILRLNQDVANDSAIDFTNLNSSHELSAEHIGKADNSSFMASGVFVILVQEEKKGWWPLWAPDSNWSTTAIVIVSTSSCWLSYLKTPLLEKTSFVAMICPYSKRGRIRESPHYKVLTWLPFASGQKLLYLGRWDPDHFAHWNKIFIDRFQDMSEKNLSTFAHDKDEPLIYIDKDQNVKGSNVNILQSFSKWLKFHNALENGFVESWNTISEDVKSGKRDVMINFSTFTPERYRDFDLSVAYHYEGYGLVLEVPPPVPRWQSILHPFANDVWLATIISTFAAVLLYRKLNSGHQNSFVVSAMEISQSLLSSPLATVPESWRVRNFLLIWWITSWILTLSWICNFIAVLTIPVFPVKIQTKEELAESKYRLCMMDYGEFVPDALRTSSESTLSTLGRKLDLVPVMPEWQNFGLEGCVDRVIDGTHAHTETFSYVQILYSQLKHTSNIYMLKEQLYPSYLSFRFPKHTPWKYKFDIGLQRLYETGLIQYWVKEAMEDIVDSKGQERSLSGQEILTLDHLQGAFFMHVIGSALATFALAGEIIYPPGKYEL